MILNVFIQLMLSGNNCIRNKLEYVYVFCKLKINYFIY